jgi:hypothetical protein
LISGGIVLRRDTHTRISYPTKLSFGDSIKKAAQRKTPKSHFAYCINRFCSTIASARDKKKKIHTTTVDKFPHSALLFGRQTITTTNLRNNFGRDKALLSQSFTNFLLSNWIIG